MQGNKLYVQKRGDVYIVPVDEITGQPLMITSVSDELPGFPMTFTSLGELKAQFPRSEFEFLQPVQRNDNRTLIVPDEVKRKAAEFMKAHGITPPAPTRTVAVAQATGATLEVAAPSYKQKAEEFLKRLQTALEYSSKKHEKKLQAQVEAIETLIKEIF